MEVAYRDWSYGGGYPGGLESPVAEPRDKIKLLSDSSFRRLDFRLCFRFRGFRRLFRPLLLSWRIKVELGLGCGGIGSRGKNG